MPVRGKKWLMRSPFQGQPKREDLEIVEEELPPIKDGGARMWLTIVSILLYRTAYGSK